LSARVLKPSRSAASRDAPDPEHALGSWRRGTDFGDRERPLKRAADL
jgi:hypothetical protein